MRSNLSCKSWTVFCASSLCWRSTCIRINFPIVETVISIADVQTHFALQFYDHLCLPSRYTPSCLHEIRHCEVTYVPTASRFTCKHILTSYLRETGFDSVVEIPMVPVCLNRPCLLYSARLMISLYLIECSLFITKIGKREK
jgi:hypothetical protein